MLSMLGALATLAAASCVDDCRSGGFGSPVLYFEWRNTTQERCCELCAANATCAFAIHRAADGMCWPAPATAAAWQTGKAGIATCRTKNAPEWPAAPAAHNLALWPAVRGSATTGDATTLFAHDFEVSCADGSGCPSAAALGWYRQRIRTSAAAHSVLLGDAAGTATVASVEVHVIGSGILLPSMNESYGLHCAGSSCTVSAAETVGAVRGLETLAHLAHAGALPLPLTLRDSPRYPYRGLLIDSARHFLPLSTIKRTLDAMSLTKLNVLHWHLTDTTAFTVESKAFPSLSQKGAIAPTLLYTQDNLREIVRYARDRGIRIVPEFDIPGHSSFGKGMPALTIAACGGALDPTQNATYTFLTAFLREMGTVFPDPYLALGGDEVSYGCAAGVPSIQKFLATKPGMNAMDLLAYFWERVTVDVLPKLNRTLYVWVEDDLSNLDPSSVPTGSVFNMYTNLGSTLNTTVARGVPGILSAPYYLDQTQSYRMGPGHAAYFKLNVRFFATSSPEHR